MFLNNIYTVLNVFLSIINKFTFHHSNVLFVTGGSQKPSAYEDSQRIPRTRRVVSQLENNSGLGSSQLGFGNSQGTNANKYSQDYVQDSTAQGYNPPRRDEELQQGK